MTETEFRIELERLAELELSAWRDFDARKRDAEATKAEAAAALLDSDNPAARKRFIEASQTLAVIEASVAAARRKREKLIEAFHEARITELRSRARELRTEAENIRRRVREILRQLHEIEEAEFIDPPHTQFDMHRRSDRLITQADSLYAEAQRLSRRGVARAGCVTATDLEGLLKAMLLTPTIPPTCNEVAEWYRRLEAAIARHGPIELARLCWRGSRVLLGGSFGESKGRLFGVREDGTITEVQASRRLAELPVPVWVRSEAAELVTSSK